MRILIASTLAFATLVAAASMPAAAKTCGNYKMYDGRVI